MYVGQARGEDAGNVKLTEADVREIRRLVNVERVKIMMLHGGLPNEWNAIVMAWMAGDKLEAEKTEE